MLKVASSHSGVQWRQSMTQNKTQAEVWNSISLDLISIQVEDKIVFINAAGAKMLGAAPDSLIGKPILDFVHPDYREIAAERMQELAGRGRIMLCPSEEKWLRLDGTTIDVEVVAMPVLYEGNSAVQLIVKKNDVYKPDRPICNTYFNFRSRRKRYE